MRRRVKRMSSTSDQDVDPETVCVEGLPPISYRRHPAGVFVSLFFSSSLLLFFSSPLLPGIARYFPESICHLGFTHFSPRRTNVSVTRPVRSCCFPPNSVTTTYFEYKIAVLPYT